MSLTGAAFTEGAVVVDVPLEALRGAPRAALVELARLAGVGAALGHAASERSILRSEEEEEEEQQ